MSALHGLEPGEHRITCPDCARGPKDQTLGVSVDDRGAAVGHCFRCQRVETYRPERGDHYRPGKALSRPVAPLKRETLSQYGVELFDACSGLRGTAGEDYLTARGCAIPPRDGDLKFHPNLKHPASDYSGPALVALVTVATDHRKRLSLHRTWVHPDGRKADVEPPRMFLGGHAKKGGVVRLWPDECVTTGLAIAEGLETALALSKHYQPSWSCLDAGNMASLPVLAGIEVLVVGADHDDAGVDAANTCGARWSDAGVDVRIIAPREKKADWADVEVAA